MRKTLDTLRQFFGTLSTQLKESDTLLRRVGMLPPETYMEENFRNHGAAFGATTLEDFIASAKKFHADAHFFKDENNGYSFINAGYGRLVVDFNGDIRGIYESDGKPVAFFRPDYQQLGYSNKQQELDEFRKGAVYKQWKSPSVKKNPALRAGKKLQD